MARKPRIEFPHAFYHIIARGNQKQKVFLSHEDYEDYLTRLKNYRDKFDFIVHAYCLMPNHVHLLIETGDIPISRIMHSLQFSYTQSFNRRHKKVGHLFQGRYKAIVCDKDAYLLELIRYIHLNPVRAKLVSDPEKYIWSSHREYLYLVEPLCVDKKSVLLFGKNKSLAVKAYRRFIRDGMKEGHKDEHYQLKDQRILGEAEFAEDLIKKTDGWQGEYWNLDVQEIIRTVCGKFDVDSKTLNSVNRCRRESLMRGIVAYLAKKLCGMTLHETGSLFNRKEQAMSYVLCKVEKKMQTEKSFMKEMTELESELIKGKRPLLVRNIKKKQNT